VRLAFSTGENVAGGDLLIWMPLAESGEEEILMREMIEHDGE
jgi:hypothetical protein